MLGNVLKHDLKNIYKFLIIFYSLAIFFAILTRIFFSIENSLIMNVIAQICSGATIAMMFNILINNLMRLWVRFKQNLYGDESYLTHTLPVKKSTLYLAKSLTGVITLFTSVGVIALTLFIAYYSKENLQIVKNFLLPVASIYGSTITKLLLIFLFVLFLEFANGLQSGFTGIILGHRKNNYKTGASVLFGFITYICTQFLGLALIYVYALFDQSAMNLFNTTQMIDLETIKLISTLAIAFYTIILIIVYFINVKLLKKGVNID